jgi:hypothetical protein
LRALKISAILRALILKGKPAMPRSSFQHGSVIMDTYGGKSSVEELRSGNAAVIDILTRKMA